MVFSIQNLIRSEEASQRYFGVRPVAEIKFFGLESNRIKLF